MHLWWSRRWSRVTDVAEYFRLARDEAMSRMRSEQDPTRAHVMFSVATGKHFAYELTKSYVLQGTSLSKALDDIGPPPGTPDAITPPSAESTDRSTAESSPSGS
jgi:hypothetical protein